MSQLNRNQELADDLVNRHVTVIATNVAGTALQAKAATSTIPIVFVSYADAVEAGLPGIDILEHLCFGLRLDVDAVECVPPKWAQLEVDHFLTHRYYLNCVGDREPGCLFLENHLRLPVEFGTFGQPGDCLRL